MFFCFCSVMAYHVHAQVYQHKRTPDKSIEAGGGSSQFGTMFYGGFVKYFNTNPLKKQWANYKSKSGQYPCVKKNIWIEIPRRSYIKISAFYEQGNGKSLRYTSSGLDAAFFYSLLKIGKSLYINAKGGLTVSMDELKNSVLNVNDQGVPVQSTFNEMKYGVLGGGEAEWILSRQITFIAGWDQRFLVDNKKIWGDTRWYGYAGLRFNLK